MCIIAHADRIRVVMDNLSTHGRDASYETFPAPEAIACFSA